MRMPFGPTEEAANIMITGEPGGGKTAWAVKMACLWLEAGETVYTNIQLYLPEYLRKRGRYVWLDNDVDLVPTVAASGKMTLPIIERIYTDVKPEKAWAPLLLIDEAKLLFSAKNWKEFPKAMNELVAMHRHLNLTICNISQYKDDVVKDMRVVTRWWVELSHVADVFPFWGLLLSLHNPLWRLCRISAKKEDGPAADALYSGLFRVGLPYCQYYRTRQPFGGKVAPPQPKLPGVWRRRFVLLCILFLMLRVRNLYLSRPETVSPVAGSAEVKKTETKKSGGLLFFGGASPFLPEGGRPSGGRPDVKGVCEFWEADEEGQIVVYALVGQSQVKFIWPANNPLPQSGEKFTVSREDLYSTSPRMTEAILEQLSVMGTEPKRLPLQ